ncbi:hypothetical protein ACQJBY_002355 [Aegilops geniculata]
MGHPSPPAPFLLHIVAAVQIRRDSVDLRSPFPVLQLASHLDPPPGHPRRCSPDQPSSSRCQDPLPRGTTSPSSRRAKVGLWPAGRPIAQTCPRGHRRMAARARSSSSPLTMMDSFSAVESVNSVQNQDFSDATLFAEINSPMLLIDDASTPKRKQACSQEMHDARQQEISRIYMDRRSFYQSLPFLTIERISMQDKFNFVLDHASVLVCAQLNRVFLVWSLPEQEA